MDRIHPLGAEEYDVGFSASPGASLWEHRLTLYTVYDSRGLIRAEVQGKRVSSSLGASTPWSMTGQGLKHCPCPTAIWAADKSIPGALWTTEAKAGRAGQLWIFFGHCGIQPAYDKCRRQDLGWEKALAPSSGYMLGPHGH